MVIRFITCYNNKHVITVYFFQMLAPAHKAQLITHSSYELANIGSFHCITSIMWLIPIEIDSYKRNIAL